MQCPGWVIRRRDLIIPAQTNPRVSLPSLIRTDLFSVCPESLPAVPMDGERIQALEQNLPVQSLSGLHNPVDRAEEKPVLVVFLPS